MRPSVYSPNADITATLSASAPILARFKKLSSDLQKKEARKVCREAMHVVRDTAIANAKQLDDPNSAEEIAKNIAIQYSAKQSKRVGGIVMRVGVRGGAKSYANTKENVRKGRAGKTYKTAGDKRNPGGDTWYWRFLEFGTSKMAARPFLQSALARNTDYVTSEVAIGLNSALDKLAPKKSAS